jgi:hypothetical protein
MTAKQRRDWVERLTCEAVARGLELERREPCRGKWVWDVRDTARGSYAVRGMSLPEVDVYLAAPPETDTQTKDRPSSTEGAHP